MLSLGLEIFYIPLWNSGSSKNAVLFGRSKYLTTLGFCALFLNEAEICLPLSTTHESTHTAQREKPRCENKRVMISYFKVQCSVLCFYSTS